MNREDCPVRNENVVLRVEFDDWAILFNPDTADAVGINPVGVAVWKLLDGTKNHKDISNNIKDEFSEVPEKVDEDIRSFLDLLYKSGFVGHQIDQALPQAEPGLD